MSNKAQGLPMNTLVIGALSLLVLVALIAMFSSGGNPLNAFSSLIGGAAPASTGQARVSCDAACNNLKLTAPDFDADGTANDGIYDDISKLSKFKYCKLTFDLSEEGGATNAKCYDKNPSTLSNDPIGSECVINGWTIGEFLANEMTGC